MKSKPDDRRDNVQRIQKNIDMTIRNMELADEMISEIPDPKTKKELSEKNERRKWAIEGMRQEMKDEEDFKRRSEN
jgi:small, acid-soluble spore protein tlp